MGEPPEIGSWECSKSSERNSLTRRQSYWYNLVNKIRKMVSFGLGKEIKKNVFFCLVMSMEQGKDSELIPISNEPQTFGFHALMLYHWVTEAMMCKAHCRVLHLYISIHILHTVIHTFPKVLIRRTWLTIKSYFSQWSLPLFLWL